MAAETPLVGSFNATGATDFIYLSKSYYNLSVWGTFVGTVQLQRSFDDGVTWLVAKEVSEPYEGVGLEAEFKVRYRMQCTAFTSGVINFRVGTRAI